MFIICKHSKMALRHRVCSQRQRVCDGGAVPGWGAGGGRFLRQFTFDSGNLGRCPLQLSDQAHDSKRFFLKCHCSTQPPCVLSWLGSLQRCSKTWTGCSSLPSMHPFAPAGTRTKLCFEACLSAPLALLLSLPHGGALLVWGIWTKLLGVNGQQGSGCVCLCAGDRGCARERNNRFQKESKSCLPDAATSPVSWL